MDRQTRANNIIIFNLEETNNCDSDQQKISKLFEEIGKNPSKFISSRLGMSNIKNLDKPRPLKVILSNTADVYSVLRSQSKLRISSTWVNIRILSDRTVIQCEHTKQRREVLQRRRVNEPNLIM
jgi:hypothetical protein|uniref:Uncharacterized protein n=1 Tax=Sipha flava TaxID=143950 RepID=A0A2S2QAE5_9HEMI